MLKITVETVDNVVTCWFDGRLAGREALELTINWSSAAFKQPDQSVVLDLSGVISVDAVGAEFLAQAQRNGYRLIGGRTTMTAADRHSFQTRDNRIDGKRLWRVGGGLAPDAL